MTSAEVRQSFLDFFKSKGHTLVPSASLMPDSPNLLFTNAGMNQFVPIFLGQRAPDVSKWAGAVPGSDTRAADTQKCIRASGKHNDLEDVGRDNYHHTFFEMLGNWSFGDYFKRDAIGWAWELMVGKWGLPADKLYATVFEGSKAEGLEPDNEARTLWSEVAGVPPERVLNGNKKDNFWEMGESGPCGPCTELHIDLGEGTCPKSGKDGHKCFVNVDGCWRFVELWNLVFIQYNRHPDGKLESLPAKHVDTGMGLERICRVLQGVDSNYATDLFTPILAAIAKVTGAKDTGGEVGVAFRVV